MKRIVLREGDRLHVETPLGIVNIVTGLRDDEGRRVESVGCIPNGYVGEPAVTLDGYANTRMIEHLVSERPDFSQLERKEKP